MAADAAEDSSNLRQRVTSALVFVPAVLLLVEATDWTLYVLVLVVVARCSWEFYQILEQGGYRPLRLPGSILAMGLCSYFWRLGKGEPLGLDLVPLLMVVALLLLVWTLYYAGTERYAANAFLTLGSVLFFGLLGSAPLLLVQTAGHGEEARHLGLEDVDKCERPEIYHRRANPSSLIGKGSGTPRGRDGSRPRGGWRPPHPP